MAIMPRSWKPEFKAKKTWVYGMMFAK
jgi:hypothetical protein